MQLNIYNTNFEAGTLVLMIFLYAYLRVKYYNKSAVNDALRRLVVVEIIATVMDLFSSITISFDAFPAWTNVLSNTLYYLALMTTSTMVVIYILAFIKDRPHYPRFLFASKAVLFIHPRAPLLAPVCRPRPVHSGLLRIDCHLPADFHEEPEDCPFDDSPFFRGRPPAAGLLLPQYSAFERDSGHQHDSGPFHRGLPQLQ